MSEFLREETANSSASSFMPNQQDNEPRPGALRERLTPTASAVLEDGALVELVYESKGAAHISGGLAQRGLRTRPQHRASDWRAPGAVLAR